MIKKIVLFALLNLMNNTIMNKTMYHLCDVNTFTCLTYWITSCVIHCITSYKFFSWISVARGYTPCFLYRLDITGNGAIVHLDKKWTLIEKYNHLKAIKNVHYMQDLYHRLQMNVMIHVSDRAFSFGKEINTRRTSYLTVFVLYLCQCRYIEIRTML